jgi:hypothetical protein
MKLRIYERDGRVEGDIATSTVRPLPIRADISILSRAASFKAVSYTVKHGLGVDTATTYYSYYVHIYLYT